MRLMSFAYRIAMHCFGGLLYSAIIAVTISGSGAGQLGNCQALAADLNQSAASNPLPSQTDIEATNAAGLTMNGAPAAQPRTMDVAHLIEAKGKALAESSRLRTQINELDQQIVGASANGLLGEIERAEAFAAKARQLRAEAPAYVSAAMAESMDLVIDEAANRAAELKAELNDRVAESAPTVAKLRRQREAKASELSATNTLVALYAMKLQEAQATRARKSEVEELKMLGTAPLVGGTGLIGSGAKFENTAKP